MSISTREAIRDVLWGLGIALLLSLCVSPGGAEEGDLEGVSGLGHPIYFTSMTHLEGDAPDFDSREAFFHNVVLLGRAMDLADAWGALLTVESEKPFARANRKWGVNFMKLIADRGHGVGVGEQSH